MPVLVGISGGRAAVMGEIPEPISTERAVQAFVESLVAHGQIEFDAGPHGRDRSPAAAGSRRRRGAAAARGGADQRGSTALSRGAEPVRRETHRVVGTGRTRTLSRIRFTCRRH
jgi:hypothetical protein